MGVSHGYVSGGPPAREPPNKRLGAGIRRSDTRSETNQGLRSRRIGVRLRPRSVPGLRGFRFTAAADPMQQ